MSPRWSASFAPKPSRGGLKNAKCSFPSKSALLSKKVCYKVSSCGNRQRQSCKAFIGLSIHAKWLVGTSPSTRKFGQNWPTLPFKNADFQSLFARSVWDVTPSEKRSINTNRKCTTSFPMSLRWTVSVAVSPQRALKNAKWLFLVQKLNNNLR